MNNQQTMIDDGGGGPVAANATITTTTTTTTTTNPKMMMMMMIQMAAGIQQQQEKQQFAPSAESFRADDDADDASARLFKMEFAIDDLPQLEVELQNRGRDENPSYGIGVDPSVDTNNIPSQGHGPNLDLDIEEIDTSKLYRNYVDWLDGLNQQQQQQAGQVVHAPAIQENLPPIDSNDGAPQSHHQSPMSEDATTDNWIVEPPPPMDAPRVERSFGKRKLAALANAGDAQSALAHSDTPPVKRNRAAASRAGQDHSKKSRNDINDGVLPHVPELQNMWRNPALRTALLQKRVNGRKVDDRIKWAKSLSPDVDELIASHFRTFEIPPRVPEVLGAFVWLAQQDCDIGGLVVEETHGKEVAKIAGSRPCGCCTFSITLETCSGRWDDLGCKLEKRQVRRWHKQQLKQQKQFKQ